MYKSRVLRWPDRSDQPELDYRPTPGRVPSARERVDIFAHSDLESRPRAIGSLAETKRGQTMNPDGARPTPSGSSTGLLTEFDVTRMLARWNGGESAALDELMPAVYQELQRLARRTMRGERSDHTLESTALVHEAFVRFTHGAPIRFQDRKHFFTLMARLMRRILVDHARSRHAARRGGGQQRVPLEELRLSGAPTERGLLLLSRALDTLHELDSRKAKVIELRFFGGLDVKQTAEILEISAPTVIADTRFARAWIYDWMQDHAAWSDRDSISASREPQAESSQRPGTY